LFFQRPRKTGDKETKPEAERTTVSVRYDSSVGKVTWSLWFSLRQGYVISSQNSVVPEASNQSLDEVINP